MKSQGHLFKQRQNAVHIADWVDDVNFIGFADAHLLRHQGIGREQSGCGIISSQGHRDLPFGGAQEVFEAKPMERFLDRVIQHFQCNTRRNFNIEMAIRDGDASRRGVGPNIGGSDRAY